MRYLVLVIGVCGVASAGLLARAGLDAGMSPLALSAWRLVIASLGLLVWRLISIGRTAFDRSDQLRLAIAGLFLAVHFATWIASLNYVSIARSTLLVATAPLWAGLAGLFVPSLRPSRLFWVGLLIAGVGTAVVTTQGATFRGGEHAWLGDLLAVIGAMAIVPYLLASQSVQKRHGTLATTTWIYSAAAVVLVVCALGTSGPVMPPSPAAWGSILGMALFAQLIGHSSLNGSLKNFTASQVATTALLEPVFAAALAWPILGEAISPMQGLGGLLLLVGVGIALSG